MYDYAYACELDGTYGFSNAKYKISGDNQSITCEYVVPNKGSHWIYIGYRKDSSGDRYNDCGYFFIDNSDKEYVIRQPKEVYLASNKMDEITYGSKKILEYGLNNTISWETLTWDKSTDKYTYNTNGPIKMYYKTTSSSGTSTTTLNTSPSNLPLNGKVYKLDFYNSIISNNTYIMPYKIDLSDWDTSYVNDMNSMFNNCNSLNYLDVSGFDTSNVTDMNNMFYNCNSLTYLDVSKFNTSNVTNMSSMFYNCNSLTSLDVSKFNTSNVTNMSDIFHYCNSLTYLDVSGFDTSNVTNMNYMFSRCSYLTHLDLSGFNTSNVTNMSGMFSGCSYLTYLDLSGFNTSKVTDITFLFYGDQLLERLNLVGWNLENLSSSPLGPFWSCPKLKTLIDGHESEPDVTVLNGLKENIDFNYCPKLNYESVYALFRGVATVTSTKTITLPKVMEGKLDADKVKIATDKGWTVAYA